MLEKLLALMPSRKMIGLFTYQQTSDKDIDDVIQKVEDACGTYGFALLHHYVYHDVVASKGFPIGRKVYVYEVCQAKVASMVLTDQAAFAPFMPCRIAVYEDGGKTVISTQNMKMMLATLKDNKELYRATNELFDFLKRLMADLAKGEG